MNCQITVEGNGVGRYGHPKHDRTGTLKDFLIDNQVFYVAVTKHLTSCSNCSVNDVLKEYLRRRVEIEKFNGRTSTSLVRRAIILEKLAKKKKELLDPGLVNEILWRGGDTEVIKHSGRLSIREKFYAFQFSTRTSPPKDINQTDLHLYQLAQSQEEFSEEELEKLLVACEIMLT